MAEAGDVQSCFELGQIFAIGEGAEQSDSAAFDWYLKAAQKGHPLAASVIGICYNNGIVLHRMRMRPLCGSSALL